VYDWFQDYLLCRKQYVHISGVNSDIGNVPCGVPQGSVLGPLLFLLYINDIGYCCPGIPVRLFADDTNIFVYGISIEVLQSHAMHVLKLLTSMVCCQ